MTIQLDVQIAVRDPDVPAPSDFKTWAAKIPSSDTGTRVCLRVADEDEVRKLNKRFRNVDKATNVLSFPADVPAELGVNFLGDVVVCAPVVSREAQAQGKDLHAHWAHLFVHGVLHLQGYTHDDDSHAEQMEALEIETLQKLGIGNPYHPQTR